jgi:hypothetical protein
VAAQAARTQLGSRRSKTDDRDCAALVWLVRQDHNDDIWKRASSAHEMASSSSPGCMAYITRPTVGAGT